MRTILFVDAGLPESLVKDLEHRGYSVDQAESAASFDAVRGMCGDLGCYSCIVINAKLISVKTVKQVFDGKVIVWRNYFSEMGIFNLVNELVDQSALN